MDHRAGHRCERRSVPAARPGLHRDARTGVRRGRAPGRRQQRVSGQMNTDLTVEVSRGVAILTLNRPDRLNAYTAEMGASLGEAYRACDSDDAVRAIVLTGAGS